MVNIFSELMNPGPFFRIQFPPCFFSVFASGWPSIYWLLSCCSFKQGKGINSRNWLMSGSENGTALVARCIFAELPHEICKIKELRTPFPYLHSKSLIRKHMYQTQNSLKRLYGNLFETYFVVLIGVCELRRMQLYSRFTEF
ncbi:hypothetical protein CEXT_653021 [Caerostris extrusa]|uniref:Uncharacterized protein n=1 Tax=Caerostris extrusa TaxID=172846 RepID=A0AAV4QQ13_CAEEX|nr:hypothetical protein CEXT_653021 [Caerostris extrusa]